MGTQRRGKGLYQKEAEVAGIAATQIALNAGKWRGIAATAKNLYRTCRYKMELQRLVKPLVQNI